MSMNMMQAFRQSPLKRSVKFVAVTLGNYHNAKTGKCNPSVPTLSRDTGISERQIVRILNSLEGTFIITESVNGRENNYRLFPQGDAQKHIENPCHCDTPVIVTPLSKDAQTPDICDSDHYKEPRNQYADDAGPDLFLFDTPPDDDPPKTPRTKHTKTTKPSNADPRHAVINRHIKEAYEEITRRRLDLDFGKFGTALSRFLKRSFQGTAEEFLDTFQTALSFRDHPKGFHCRNAADPCYLCAKWLAVTSEIEALQKIEAAYRTPKSRFSATL